MIVCLFVASLGIGFVLMDFTPDALISLFDPTLKNLSLRRLLGIEAIFVAAAIIVSLYFRFRHTPGEPVILAGWAVALLITAGLLRIVAVYAELFGLLFYCGMINSHVGFCRLDL
jgi:hypothetical protein